MMSQCQRCQDVRKGEVILTVLRGIVVTIVLGALLLLPGLAGCSESQPEAAGFPPLSRGEIEGFWAGTYSGSREATPDLVLDEALLTRLVDAYNAGTLDPWPLDPSAPSAYVTLLFWLKDGGRARVMVQRGFPADHAWLAEWNVPEGRAAVTYKVRAPELVAIAKALAQQRLEPYDRFMLDPDGTWLGG